MKRTCKGCGLELIKFLDYCSNCGKSVKKDNIPESNEYPPDVFEFKDSKLLYISLNLIIGAVPLVYFLIGAFIIKATNKLAVIGISVYLLSIPLISMLMLYIFGVPRVSFSLTHSEIKVIFKKKLLFQAFWESVSRIELIKEIFPQQNIGGTKWKEGYAFIFIVPEEIHTLRLWNLPIQRRHKDYLLSSLEQYFIKMDKELVDKGRIVQLSKSEYWDIFEEMLKFNRVKSKWLMYRRPKL